MFPKFVGLSSEQLSKLKHPSLYKSIQVQIKFDGTSWVDVSSYVKAIKITNDIDLSGHVKADSFSITVANLNNEWSKTQYWDKYDPGTGKFNGTQEEAYLSKVLPVIVSAILDGFTEVYLAIGYITDITENVSKKTATLQCSDILWKAAKKKLEETLVYVERTPNSIIEDLAFRCGFSSFTLDIQEMLTVINTKVDAEETYLSAIDKIVQGTGGKLSATPDGKIIFRSRFENYTDPAIVDTLTTLEIQSLKIPEQRNPINHVEVHSEGYSLQEKGKIFESQETITIAPGATYPDSGVLTLTFEEELNINIEEEIEIKYDGSSLGKVLRLGDGEDDGELKIKSLKIYENRAEVIFENIGAGNIYIREMRMYGEALKKISENDYIYENDTDDEDSTLSVETFYEDSADLETIAKIYREDKGKKVLLQATLNEFWGHVYAGNLIEVQLPEKGISSGTFIITSVTHNIRERKWITSLSLAEFKDLSYFVGTTTSKVTRLNAPEVEKKIAKVQAEKVDESTVGYWRDSLLDVIKFALPYGMSTMKMTDNVEITDANIPAGTITETHIADDQISTPKLKANSVTADRLSATLEMFVGQILKVGGKIEIYRDASTGEGKIVIKDDLGNEIIKIGESVLPDGSNGIWLNSSNMVVDGQIDTDYLDLQKAITVMPGDFVTAVDASSLFPSSITINNIYTVEKTENFITPVSIVTAKGTKNYYKFPLFKLSCGWYVDYGDFYGGYPGYAHGGDLIFEIIVDGITVFSDTQTDVWFRHYQNGDSYELDFYQLLANNGIIPRANLPITFKLTIDDYKKDDFAPDTVDNGSAGYDSYMGAGVWDVYPTLPVL